MKMECCAGEKLEKLYEEEKLYEVYKKLLITTYIRIQNLRWLGQELMMEDSRIVKKWAQVGLRRR